MVVNRGHGIAPLKWYECHGDPANPARWCVRDLLRGRVVMHGHSLQVADIDGGGKIDIHDQPSN